MLLGWGVNDLTWGALPRCGVSGQRVEGVVPAIIAALLLATKLD